MQLHKSYKLLRFLNRRHSAVSRYSLATLGWLGTLVCTREPALARAIAAEFKTNNYELAFRKGARYARHFSQIFKVINDPFFNFTQNTTQAERSALLNCLHRNRKKLTPENYLTDQLYILAANIHEQLEHSQQPDADIAQFYELASQVIALTKEASRSSNTAAIAPRPAQPPNFNRAQAAQALQDLATVLPLAQWPWFIISGTFLGLHREGSFLAHDYDVDTGIHAEGLDVDHLLKTLHASGIFDVKKLDYYVEVLRGESGRSLRKRPSMIKLVHQNGMQVDIFIHYIENGQCWHGSIIHRWNNTPFGLAPREFEGVTVLAPDNADLYLTENYGNWRTPVKNYDCTTGTPNLVISGNFVSHALLIKRYLHLVTNAPRDAQKLRHALVQSGFLKHNATDIQLTSLL